MNKKKTIDSNKPPEILELEKIYNIQLKEEKEEDMLQSYLPGNSFSLNKSEKISCIAITSHIIKDVSPFNILKDIIYLNLTGNLIVDISVLNPNLKLKYLYLGGNRIKSIKHLLNYTNLIELAIWDNPIEDIGLICDLNHLQCLYCQSTNISSLNFVSKLVNLKTLYADDNNIHDINVLESLLHLEDLHLDRNIINNISVLEPLISLNVLLLNSNNIKKIPYAIAHRFYWLNDSTSGISYRLKPFDIANNPLTFPPVSVIESGSETVQNYYETADQFGHAPLSEGRIIFVGDGSSGKSSIIEKILYNTPFDIERKQTNGINIEKFSLKHPEDNRNLIFHIWDFGGQEIQHAVHKFFFTEGCLYILVLDNRKEEEPEYWLQQIESLGGKAPVLVVFNKQDENAAETADRKFLKEKYPNIVGFYNTSCLSGFGIDDLKKAIEKQAIELKTVNEQFPNNWFKIKKAIEGCTSGNQHYLNYDSYKEICKQNHVELEQSQRLLLKYFTTIGSVTWFGDTYLNFMHVLKPAWITQGVYKILTSKKTAKLFGQIKISDFKEMLHPVNEEDYTYEEKHYGYILSMMKKFDLCYTSDDKNIFIPSAFGKMPKLEYSEFRGENVRTYILQFKDYMPLALIHRYTAKNLSKAFENNYWYSGIVRKDDLSDSLAMVHADKEAKRIYIRIKGESQLGMWEHIRRELSEIASSYANINYDELVALDEKADNTVSYDDLVGHLQAGKATFFHPKLKRDYYVGYLMGIFEAKDGTIEKVKQGIIPLERENQKHGNVPQFILQILQNNSQTVSTNVNTQINIDIDLQIVNELGSNVRGEADFLLESLDESNKILREALQKVIQFADDAKAARNSDDVKEKGWGRKLKKVLQTLGSAGEQFKNIQDGSEALKSMFKGLYDLAHQFNLHDIADFIMNLK